MHIEDKKYAAVFTDVHEYDKLGFGDSFILIPHNFDFYLDLLDEEIDGIIIDVEGERFPLFKGFEDFMKPSKMNEASNPLTEDEIKRIKNSINNDELENFLKDESNHWDNLLLKSLLFTVILSRDDLSNSAEDGLICLNNMGNLPLALTNTFTENYALLYTSESEVVPKINPMHPYLQLVNLSEFIENVLLYDLDGIVLNENSQNIHIPTQFLFEFIKNLEDQCPNKYDDYAFLLGN